MNEGALLPHPRTEAEGTTEGVHRGLNPTFKVEEAAEVLRQGHQLAEGKGLRTLEEVTPNGFLMSEDPSGVSQLVTHGDILQTDVLHGHHELTKVTIGELRLKQGDLGILQLSMVNSE